MKINKTLFYPLILLFLLSGKVHAQFNKEEQIIIKAMKDQLKTSLDSLKSDNSPRPSFIQYNYKKGETNMLRYNRGALFEEDLAKPVSLIRVDMIIKDDKGVTSHNSSHRGFPVLTRMRGGQDVVPTNPDYDEIRRVFWWLSDVQYRNAVNAYNDKVRKMSDPTLAEKIKKDMDLPDFPSLPKTTYYDAPAQHSFDASYWHELLAEVSGVYDEYKELYDICARLETSCQNIYTLNTEGTETRHAITDITLHVSVVAQNERKESFSENLFFTGLTAEDLPSKLDILAQTKEAADLVLKVSKAEAADKEYLGPALLDAPLVIDHNMFSTFTAVRIPAAGAQAPDLNSNIGLRIYSPNLSIKATPTLKEYKGHKLLGSYSVDAEGVKPKESLLFVEKGVVKELMNDRVPTAVVAESTGNNLFIGFPMYIGRLVMPGVIQVTCSDTKPAKGMKAELIKNAKEAGLKHAFIIRRLKNGSTYWFYKVNVGDGSEELVRNYRLNLGANRPLRRILCSSKDTNVFHLKLSGVNNSVIAPDAFLLEEVVITK